MKLSYRLGLYLFGGALILTWINPPQGLLTYGLILLLIVGAAYLDAWLFRPGLGRGGGHNVVSLASFRTGRARRSAGGGSGRERRVLHTVYSSAFHVEADALLHMLRAEGMNPMLVSQNRSQDKREPLYEVRLPEKEVRQAKPLIQLFLIRSAKAPS